MKTRSLLRQHEYRMLGELTLTGKVLDVGGAKRSGYQDLIKGEHTFTVGNIDPSYGVDVVFDAEGTWPFDTGSYDAVLFINVLEHLYRYDHALDEATRVLVAGGRIVGVVPFMFNVHGSPNDYFRFTRSALERMLTERGFSDVRIVELGTGATSVAYHAFFGIFGRTFLAPLFIALARGIDRLILRMKPSNLMSARYMPLGYYFEATKGV